MLSGTLSTSCACANPNTLMRLICKKQESGLLSTFSFLYALCQTKYTTHNTHQTNMRKKESGRFLGPFSYTHTALLCAKQNTLFQTNVQKNPNIFRFRLLFPPQTVKYLSFHWKNSHSVKLLSWAIRFTPHSMKQFLFVKHTRKHKTRGRAVPLLFFQPTLLCEMFLL